MTNQEHSNVLPVYLDAWREEAVTFQQSATLNDVLLRDPAARQELLRNTFLHAYLEHTGKLQQRETPGSIEKAKTKSSWNSPLLYAASLAVFILMGGLVVLFVVLQPDRSPVPTNETRIVFELTEGAPSQVTTTRHCPLI